SFAVFVIFVIHFLFYPQFIENGPITRKGKKVSAVSRNVMISRIVMNRGPFVFMGSITSFLSLTVKEPAIAIISPNGTYLPRNITIPVVQFQNGRLADEPK